MLRSKGNNPTETDGSEALWLRDLSCIETYYGRLVYLAQLRNPDTGRYEHYGSTPGTTSNLIASRSLKRIHETIFRDWVSFSLERKKKRSSPTSLALMKRVNPNCWSMLGSALNHTEIWFPLPFKDLSASVTSLILKPFLGCLRTYMASLRQIETHSHTHYLADYIHLSWIFVNLW